MKRIIINPDGIRRTFDFDELEEFHVWLFAILAGVPKRVVIEFDEDFNEVYRVNYG